MTLEYEIFARNMEVSDRINEYVDKKIAKLDKLINNIVDTRVDLTYAKSARSASDRHVAQVTIRGKGFILRAEERADDIFTAIDESIEKMSRQIARYKGKHYRGRGGIPLGETAIEPEEVIEEPQIVRRKQFELTPMDEMEAVEQMNLLGHENFFVFFNVETNSINILYHRRDGSYGLIEPKIA
jgi:putative sigma-54 modulation protein